MWDHRGVLEGLCAFVADMTRELIVQLLASITTLISMWFYGSKSLYGPSLAIMGQVFWWIIMFQGKLWGLLPLNIAMAIMHVRNLIKWRRDAAHDKRS